jgi:CheY-like chemotaxis protein
MDIEMPLMDRIEATRRILAADSAARWSRSAVPNTKSELDVRQAGAVDYTRKSRFTDELVKSDSNPARLRGSQRAVGMEPFMELSRSERRPSEQSAHALARPTQLRRR